MDTVQGSFRLSEATTCTDSCETVICSIYMKQCGNANSMWLTMLVPGRVCGYIDDVRVNRIPAVGSTSLQWYNSSEAKIPFGTHE